VTGTWTPTDWVDYNSRRFADEPALDTAETGVVITWRELEDLVGRTARVLRDEFGVGAGDRVSVIAENDVRFFILQFATMRLGAIFVPLNWRLTRAELAPLIEQSRPSVVVHDETWGPIAQTLAGDVGAALLSWDESDKPDNLAALCEKAIPLKDEGIRRLDDPVQILFTSGTTGHPKGALVSGATLLWNALNVTDINEIRGPGDRLLLPLPLFHAGGLNTLANPILLFGGCVSVSSRFEAGLCLTQLGTAGNRYTHFGSVPTMYQLMTELPHFPESDFSSLKHVQVSGGVVSTKLLNAWAVKGVWLQCQYGGTEMGPGVTAMPRSWARAKPGSCGFPLRHTRLRLVTTEGRDAAIGEIGEVWISGPSVTPGYFENAAATAEAFSGEWFRTGDAGRFDDDGFLYLVDRYKDMYKSGGENVFPAEVERVLLEHPDVSEAVVLGVPDPRWGETGIAVIVSRTGAELTREDIVAHCEGRIARYKFPSAVYSVESLPRNVTGKVVKAELREVYAPSPVSQG
jgi:fatty-acyl-CoA synthase